MLKYSLIHPQILHAIGAAGHGSRVLIADGNYPASTKLGANAILVNLNLRPGLVNCTQVLETLIGAMPIEAAMTMQYATAGPYALSQDPPIWNEYRQILRDAKVNVELEPVERFNFYHEAGTPDVALTIQTGEQRIYANLLLTIGVVKPG